MWNLIEKLLSNSQQLRLSSIIYLVRTLGTEFFLDFQEVCELLLEDLADRKASLLPCPDLAPLYPLPEFYSLPGGLGTSVDDVRRAKLLATRQNSP